MASVSMPARPQRSLIGRLAAACGDGRLRKLAASAGVAAREHLPTLAALGSVDYGAFRGGPVAGWIVLGVSVLVAEWKMRD